MMKQDISTGCLVTVEQAELDRRIKAIRELMEEVQADLFLTAAPIKNGWGKWLTGTDGPGRPCEGGILIGKTGDVLVVNGGALVPRGATGIHNDAMAPGCVGEGFLGYSTFDGFSADVMEQMAGKTEGKMRIVVVNMSYLRADLNHYLEENLGCPELINVEEKADTIRAKKSEAELGIIDGIVKMMDKIFAGAGVYINPKRSERDVVTDLRYAAYRLGCGGVDHQISAPVELTSQADGEPKSEEKILYPGRFLEFGDRVNIKMYALGNDGYYGGMARSFVLGKPSEETEHLWKIAVEVQEKAASLLRPGVSVQAVADKVNKFLKEQGCKEDKSIMIHSIGESIQENPCVFGEIELPVEENMVFYIGPVVDDGKADPLSCGDLYMVGKEETKRLTTFPRKLISLY